MNLKPTHKAFVEIRIIKPGVRASSVPSAERAEFLPEGEDFVFHSRLDPTVSVSEHLKWLHSMLHFERKRFRQLQANGVETVFRIRVRARAVTIEPEALHLMHHCNLKTQISFNP